MRRVGLPPGGSTLTTSAPRPARVSPQYSACSSASSTTPTPVRAPRDRSPLAAMIDAAYCFSLIDTPAPASASLTPCVVATRFISTPFWFLSAATAAPPPTAPPAPAAVQFPTKCSTLFRFLTSPRALTFETPRSTTLSPSTVHGYFFPWHSRTPSTPLTPTPIAPHL